MNNQIHPCREKPKNPRKVIIRLMGYILHDWPYFLLAIVMTICSNQLALLGPRYSGIALDAVADPSGVNFSVVTESTLKMLACYLISAVTSYALAVLMVKISQRIVYKMRKQLFEKLTALPVSYFDRTAAGDIISCVSYDIDTLNASLSTDTVQVMTSFYTVIGSVIFMLKISKPLTLIFCITIPISVLFSRYRSKRVRPLFRKRSIKLAQLNGYAEEMLSGCRTISAYHQEAEVERRFSEKNTTATDACFQADYYASSLGPVVGLINNISLSLVVIFGGILYMYSQSGILKAGSAFFITLGGVAQFVQYSRKFAGPINEFANILHEFQSAFSAAERVFHIIDSDPEKQDQPDAVKLQNVKGSVSFQHVTFGYTDNETILQDLSISVTPGQTIAIVGPTGAGKTTIINLLMRFYDPQGGQITVEGIPIQKIQRSSLRESFAMVLQDTWLFHGTIFDNIAYGREGATRDEVIDAAKKARIHSYIASLPNAYDTILSDDGTNISKGQRQLITIARAMLSRAPMLILDEATSNVDSETEIKIQQAMALLMKGRTSFIIAHRLSTIRNADLILVLQNGKITEKGNHETLMQKNGFYSSLYNAQFH